MRTVLITMSIMVAVSLNSEAQIDPVKRHIIEGTYYLIVEEDSARAQSEFSQALAADPKNTEASYLTGRTMFERVIDGDLPRSKLSEAERLIRSAAAQGIVYNKLHPDLLGLSKLKISVAPRMSFWGIAHTTARAEPPVSAVGVLEMPVNNVQFILAEPDEEGYEISRAYRPGDLIEFNQGKKYRVDLRGRSEVEYTKILIPVIALVGVIWLSSR